MSLAHARCFNHASREAVARCRECGRDFCRECISEHEDRIVCAFCLKQLSGKDTRRGQRAPFFLLTSLAVALLLLWTAFYGFGKTLLAIPASFQQTGSGSQEHQER